MIRTTKGMPNTCSNCGAGPLEECWAETVDHARAGLGLCEACALAQKPAEPEAAESGQDWLWTGLTEPQQRLLQENGVTAAWLREASEEEIHDLDRIKGIGPGTTHHLVEMRDEWLSDDHDL